jgi:hypothetical protein
MMGSLSCRELGTLSICMFVLDGRPIEEGLYPAAGETGSYFFIPVFLTAVYITYKRLIMPVCDIGKININNTRYLKSKQVK